MREDVLVQANNYTIMIGEIASITSFMEMVERKFKGNTMHCLHRILTLFFSSRLRLGDSRGAPNLQ